jgi:hypothetical protein
MAYAESFGPVILRRRAKRMRLEDPSVEVMAPIELQHRSVRDVIVVTLTRPIRLLAEPIVLICCTYLAFEYAIFYIFFVAYPIIFEGTYGPSTSTGSYIADQSRDIRDEHWSCNPAVIAQLRHLC